MRKGKVYPLIEAARGSALFRDGLELHALCLDHNRFALRIEYLEDSIISDHASSCLVVPLVLRSNLQLSILGQTNLSHRLAVRPLQPNQLPSNELGRMSFQLRVLFLLGLEFRMMCVCIGGCQQQKSAQRQGCDSTSTHVHGMAFKRIGSGKKFFGEMGT